MTATQGEILRIKAIVVEQGANMVIAFNSATQALTDAQALGVAATSPELKAAALVAEGVARDERWRAIEAAYSVLFVNFQALLDAMLKQDAEPGKIVGVTLLTDTKNSSST